MDFVDLLGLLRNQKTKGLEKVSLYGKIVRQTGYPSVLQQGVALDDGGIFVEMKVFAINLKHWESYLKDLGIYNEDSIYMVNGSVVAYVERAPIKGVDWYTIEGTVRLASRDAASNVVSVFNFYKTQNNAWGLHACRVSDIEMSEWAHHSAWYSWMCESGRVGDVRHPDTVLALPKFNSFKQEAVTPVINNTEPEQVVERPGSKVENFVKENRDTVKPYNEMHDKFEVTLRNAKTRCRAYIDSLVSDYGEGDTSEYLDYMLSGLVNNFKRKGDAGVTGRMLISKYLDNFKGASAKYIGNSTCAEHLLGIFDTDIVPYIKDRNATVMADGKAWELCKQAFGDEEQFYAGVVGLIIGISFDTMTSICDICGANDISIIQILNENPYLLQFVSDLSYDEIERVALCFGKHNDRSLDEFRNVSMLNAFIMDSNDGSTIFTKTKLTNAGVGLRLTKARYDKMRTEGTYLTPYQTGSINAYIRPLTAVGELGYSPENFKKKGYYFIRALSAVEVMDAVKQYEKTGLGIIEGEYVTSSRMLERELFVFDTMYELGRTQNNYDHARIDELIDEYEGIVGFKLEERQRMAVHLLVNNAFVVAGSAGSGKTTVSNCVVFVLEHLEPNLNIRFAAPTGKAAKRMQEVVQQQVKTMHSEFKLGVGTDFVLSQEEDADSDIGDIAYFFDEGAMVTIDLLYKVLKRIDISSTRIFLFGDFNQLPPIGKGLPFKNLLRFMPCVFLNVSKRAAEGSGITKNSNFVNEYSDRGNWRQLESGGDFVLLPCKSEMISKTVYAICAYYLGRGSNPCNLPDIDGITADDIQVVSPLSKEAYNWGTMRLNELLQPLFNTNNGYEKSFVVGKNKFTLGDRVIHTDKNMYSMQWYSYQGSGTFQKIYGQGICNGEVGKIVGFVPSTDCMFLDEDEEKPDDFEYMSNLRDDSSWCDSEKWFVIVEYYDYISSRNFVILYRCEEDTYGNENRGRLFKHGDLDMLNLFYAGTTHKLQGSQAKVIICALDDVSFGGFITRQMVYTMFTRGEKLVVGVGSVGNEPSSMLSRARLDVASVDTKTVGELLI